MVGKPGQANCASKEVSQIACQARESAFPRYAREIGPAPLPAPFVELQTPPELLPDVES